MREIIREEEIDERCERARYYHKRNAIYSSEDKWTLKWGRRLSRDGLEGSMVAINWYY